MQIGSLGGGDLELEQLAGHGIEGQVHDAVDLRCLVDRAPAPRGIDQHLARLADQLVPSGRGDPVLQLGALTETLQRQFARHMIREVGRMGARLGREREEPGPIELGLGQELKEPVMVALGLPGIAQDEGGAERGAVVESADVGHPAQEALAIAPSTHAGQQWARDVLEREVEVGHAGGHHRLNELIGQPGRVEIEQPGARHEGGDGPGQRRNR